MTIGLLFWILMVIWAVFGIYRGWSTPPAPPWPFAGDLLLFILLLLLGIHAFGWPIKG